MKGAWAFTTCTLALMLSLSGCGSTETPASSTGGVASEVTTDTAAPLTNGATTVTLWHYYGSYVTDELEEIVKEFHATVGAEENIKVELVGKTSSSELEIELTESAQGVVYADEMPDIFMAYADKVLELQTYDAVADLDLYFTEEEKARLIPDFLESGVVNGIQSIIPTVKSTEVIYLNVTSWQEFANASGHNYDDLVTWDSIMEVAKDYYIYTDALTPDVANDGKALFGLDSVGNFMSVSSRQMGTDIFDSENHTALMNPESIYPGYSWYTEAFSMGYLTEVGSYRSDDIRSGDILAYAGSSAGYLYFPDWIEVNGEKIEVTWKALPYPHFEEGDAFVMSQGAGACIAKKDGIQEEAAATFLKFFLNYNIDFAVNSAYVPVVAEFLEDEALMLATFQEKELGDNVVETYGLVMDQIENGQLYQPRAFNGSYTVRTELASAVSQSAVTLREVVLQKQSEGKERDTILDEIDLAGQFDQTMETLRTKLESKNITVG